MSGSLNHIVGDDGTFNSDMIEQLWEAKQALGECYTIIAAMANGGTEKISYICRSFGFVDPWDKDRSSDEPMPAHMKPAHEAIKKVPVWAILDIWHPDINGSSTPQVRSDNPIWRNDEEFFMWCRQHGADQQWYEVRG